MPVKPVLYIHIGHSKVGSSTIQKFIFENTKQLQQLNVFPFDHNLTVRPTSQVHTPPTAKIEALLLTQNGSADHVVEQINRFMSENPELYLTIVHRWVAVAINVLGVVAVTLIVIMAMSKKLKAERVQLGDKSNIGSKQ